MSRRFVPSYRATVIFLGVLLSLGCIATPVARVARSSPKPNIDLPERNLALGLTLDEQVKDAFKVPRRSGIPETEVTAWRTTLERGFHNGLGTFFRTKEEKSELTLQLVEVDLEFVPSAVNGYGQAAAAEAHVRYKARLLDAVGNVVRRSSGTVTSKRSTGDHNEFTLVALSAVETMYERIASDLFSDSATADVLK